MSSLNKYSKQYYWYLLYDQDNNPFALAYEGPKDPDATPHIFAYRLDNKEVGSLYMIDNKQTIKISDARAKIIAKAYGLSIKDSLRFNPL